MEFPDNFFGWLHFWWEYYYKPSVQETTGRCAVYKIRMIQTHSENCKLECVDEFYCQKILNRLAEAKYARDSISKIKFILQRSLRVAYKRGLIDMNPTEELILPKAPTKVVNALSPAQQIQVESVCAHMAGGHIIQFMLCTGLRRSEIQNLSWDDFDQKQREIFIKKSKTKAGIRTIPLINTAYQIILAQMGENKDGYIFHSPSGGKLNDVFMKRLYMKVRESTGIHSFTNHVCRHTFATRLVERGASPKSVCVLLGHARVEYALNIYTSLEKRHIRKEIFLLEQAEREFQAG